MRRMVSRLLVSFALCFASLALSAHVLNVVAFDPGRPTRVLAAMLDTAEGRSLAAETISAQLQRLDPPMSPARADKIAAHVAADPHLRDSLRGSDGSSQADVLEAVLDSVATQNPRLARQVRTRLHRGADGPGAGEDQSSFSKALDSVVPAVSDRVATIHTTLSRATHLGSLLALGLAAFALLLGPRRDLLMRSLGRWSLGVAAGGVLLWLLLPDVVLPHLSGRWPVVVAAGLHAAGAGLAWLFAGLLAAGLLCLVTSYAGGFLVPVLHDREVPDVVRRAAARRGRDRRAAQRMAREASIATPPAAGEPLDPRPAVHTPV